MLDVLAKSYMTAARMDQFLEQDFMHRNPRIAQRLRYIHGLDEPNPGFVRRARMRVGMDGSIERARKPFLGRTRRLVAKLGTGISWIGGKLESAAATSFQREICPSKAVPMIPET